MGSFAANNITTWFSGYDMTGDLNNTSLALSYDALDATAFQPGTVTAPARVRVAGLEDAQLDEAGWWQAGSGQVDPTAFTALGGASQVVSVSPNGLEENAAYFFRAREFSYELFGQLGEVAPFRLTAQSARGTGLASVPAVRGIVLKTKADVSATGATGTASELGAVGASQYLYAGLHVFSAGTTITVQVQSDDAAGFSSATTRGTIGPITTAGGTWMTRVAGPFVGETHWRMNISAITGTFSVAGAIAVQ